MTLTPSGYRLKGQFNWKITTVYDTILGNTQAKTIEPQKLETYKATSREALKSNTYMATIRRG